MHKNEPGFHYQDGQLQCEGVALQEIAASVGTPCYVYSSREIVSRYKAFSSHFASVNPKVCFAVKANSNLSLLKLLKDQGSGFDVVSGGELYRVQQIGADPKKVLFSGVGKTREELDFAMGLPVGCINVESVAELDLVSELAKQRGGVRIGLRINPDVQVPTHPHIATGLRQHKFGISLSEVPEIVVKLRRNPAVELIGVAGHIGSQILQVEPFISAFVKLQKLARQLRSENFPITHLDLGGGFGIPYQGEADLDWKKYADFLEENIGDYSVYFEPGRVIVGPAGILMCKVLYRKSNQGKQFVVVDGGMNDFMRPSLYDAYHEVLPLRESEPSSTVDIVGPLCESGDFFARGRQLAEVRSGDYLSIMDTGAYGFTLSSNYNSRPRAPEVLVEGNHFRIIRSRETLPDLVQREEVG